MYSPSQLDIFRQYPDLHTEMIEEKGDAELLQLYKSMQPQLAGAYYYYHCFSCRSDKAAFVFCSVLGAREWGGRGHWGSIIPEYTDFIIYFAMKQQVT